jgi:hypothetical protein
MREKKQHLHRPNSPKKQKNLKPCSLIQRRITRYFLCVCLSQRACISRRRSITKSLLFFFPILWNGRQATLKPSSSPPGRRSTTQIRDLNTEAQKKGRRDRNTFYNKKSTDLLGIHCSNTWWPSFWK